MSVSIIQGDARKLGHIADGSVDLVLTSPPYWQQRCYEDGGSHLEGQIGNEPHPRYWLGSLYDVMKELWRVLAPGGSVFVNLGDKRAASGAPGTTSGLGGIPQGARTRIAGGYTQAYFGRPKSRQLLPERFAIGCEDGLADPDGVGWIVRQVIIWEKLSGLPESVTDRTRDNFEYLYHFTKEGSYYSAIDELREPTSGYIRFKNAARATPLGQRPRAMTDSTNPLGRLPGSVWPIVGEPLRIPEFFIEDEAGWRMFGLHAPARRRQVATRSQDALDMVWEEEGLERNLRARWELWRYAEERFAQGCTYLRVGEVDHYAAMTPEVARRVILGWSLPAVCLRCGEGRFPVTEVTQEPYRPNGSSTGRPKRQTARNDGRHGFSAPGYPQTSSRATICGYACACTPVTTVPGSGRRSPTAGPDGRQGARPMDIEANHERVGPRRAYHLDGWDPPATRPAVVLDPFCGTGTTCGVGAALGRDTLGVDLSLDYVRLARWRCSQPGQWAKAKQRSWAEAQGSLF